MNDEKIIKDEHTHKIIYKNSMEATPNKIDQLRKESSAKLRGAFEGQLKIKDTSPEQLNKEDGVTIS